MTALSAKPRKDARDKLPIAERVKKHPKLKPLYIVNGEFYRFVRWASDFPCTPPENHVHARKAQMGLPNVTYGVGLFRRCGT